MEADTFWLRVRRLSHQRSYVSSQSCIPSLCLLRTNLTEIQIKNLKRNQESRKIKSLPLEHFYVSDFKAGLRFTSSVHQRDGAKGRSMKQRSLRSSAGALSHPEFLDTCPKSSGNGSGANAESILMV
ncbi:hypothetical protein EVAR_83063_1 [Eumeta japonica]|uniref:Uncharacterized protein n=1 Tax=Eumeta variegata TaxID=151549 RepID=A0A4C1VLM1_EUMVA|nr:hypothetical protein EVAR_83063_1 [Eumeta japonica]